jgi:hypothetical protein
VRTVALAACAAVAVSCTSPAPARRSAGPSSAPPSTSASTSGSPPATGTAGGFGFAVLGDFGSGDDDEHQVADELHAWTRSHRFDALVTTGDNVYESGDPSDFPASWNEPYGWVDAAGIPVIAALGNHDEDAEGNTEELDLFHIPGRWYARTVGPVRFVVLDANDPEDPDQLAWLRGELARDTGAAWTVAVFHQPAFSCGFHQSTQAVDERWVPLFGPAGVDLVLNGHDHAYQRFAPIDGVTYVVQGAGGAHLYPVSSILCPSGTPNPAVAVDDHHLFLYLTASRYRLAGRAVTADGEVVDSFEVPGR